jgi:hypothetical protein
VLDDAKSAAARLHSFEGLTAEDERHFHSFVTAQSGSVEL